MVGGWRLPEQRQKVDKIKMKLVAAFVLLRDFSARIISEITICNTNNMRNKDFLTKLKWNLWPHLFCSATLLQELFQKLQTTWEKRNFLIKLRWNLRPHLFCSATFLQKLFQKLQKYALFFLTKYRCWKNDFRKFYCKLVQLEISIFWTKWNFWPHLRWPIFLLYVPNFIFLSPSPPLSGQIWLFGLVHILLFAHSKVKGIGK